MANTVTIDDIWKLFQETNRMFERTQAEIKQRFEENERVLREEKALRERERQERERERQEQERVRERERQEQERVRERERQEREREMQETARIVRETSRKIDALGSRWGEFVEGLVAPGCEAMFAERGIDVRQVHSRIKAKLPGNRHMEIDLLAVDGDVAILVEVKSKLKAENVREHLARLAEFKEFFPRYAECRVLGAVAGIVIDENVDRYAMNEGLFLIVQSGETVKLANPPEFTPKSW